MTENAQTPATDTTAGKTFTQDQVNALLAKEKRAHQAALDAAVAAVVARAEAAEAKVADYEAEKQRAEWIVEICKDSGVPAHLLRGETREELQAHHDELAAALTPAPPSTPPIQGVAFHPEATQTPSTAGLSALELARLYKRG